MLAILCRAALDCPMPFGAVILGPPRSGKPQERDLLRHALRAKANRVSCRWLSLQRGRTMETLVDTPTSQPASETTKQTAVPEATGVHSFKYRAFITYSHDDGQIAERIHKGIESYRIPRSLVGQPGRDGPVPQKLFPLFRDRAELSSSPDLSAVIREALAQSAYLIV